MKTKIYVGIAESGSLREIFYSDKEPTPENTPWFTAVIGPFRTKRGAEYCREFGGRNPHIQCVADAERLAALHASQSQACKDMHRNLSRGKFAYPI